jgi:hypothetical protein
VGLVLSNDALFAFSQKPHRLFPLAFLVPALLLHLGCGGSGSSSSGGGPPPITSVTVSGPTYTQAGQCANFIATVSGTGNFDHSAQWYVNGTAGGDASKKRDYMRNYYQLLKSGVVKKKRRIDENE